MGKTPHPLDSWRAANAAEADAVRAAAGGGDGEQPAGLSAATELLLGEAVRADLPPDTGRVTSIPPRAAGDIIVGAIFGVIAAGWIAVCISAAASNGFALADVADSIAMASGPLALLGIFYMLLQRGTRGEVRRFGDTALSMRIESRRLEEAVARITAVLDNRRADLAAHTDSLLEEANRAAGRLQQISMDMRDETDVLARQSSLLHEAAGVARSDISGLMQDLPASLKMVEEVDELLRSIGGHARQHAEALSETLTAIITRSHEADELIGAASGRLATQIGRIESRADRTARTIEDVAAALGSSVDASLDRASAAIDHSRSSLDLQREAMAAMIEHGRAALDEAGTAAAASLAERLAQMSALAGSLAEQLARQDEEARGLITNLERALGSIEGRFESLGTTSAEQTADIAELVVSLSGHVDNLSQAITTSMAGARGLTERANGLRIAFDAIIANLDRDLPQTMQRVELEAERGDTAMRAITAQAEQLGQTIERATERLDSTSTLIERQRTAVMGLGDAAARRMVDVSAEGDALLERQRELSDAFAEEATARLEALRDHSGELGRLITATEAKMRSLAEMSGSHLVEAILQIRETAGQAARDARASLEAIIPDASELLRKTGAEAIQKAFGEQIVQRITLISDTAEAAVAAANHASERLMQQALSIAETVTGMEKRVADSQATMAQRDEEGLGREVAALIDHLNAAAIDVTKLMSHNVPDGAWRAYLHGDNGAFTRSAVRLLRQEEAGRIAALYDADPAFREHVNRYIHDFEALLRRVLASRDGSALTVTILSSDMGKLYVALAQAIERLLI